MKHVLRQMQYRFAVIDGTFSTCWKSSTQKHVFFFFSKSITCLLTFLNDLFAQRQYTRYIKTVFIKALKRKNHLMTVASLLQKLHQKYM